jgi:signal transduction histidine kinase
MKLIKIGFFWIMLLPHVLNVNGQVIDSLEQKLQNNSLNPIERIETMNLLSRDLTYINQTRALELANEALDLSTANNYLNGIAYAYRNLSGVYSYNEVYFLSINYVLQAIDIFKQLNDSVGIANCYISLGHTYRRLQKRDDEVNYHKRSYEIFSRLGIPERIGVTSHNLGESYFHIGDYEKCRQLTEYAIIINDSINNLAVLTSCYRVMGLLEFNQNNYKKAEEYFNKVLKISEELGENSQKTSTIESMIQLAELYKLKGDTKSQIDILEKASLISNQSDFLRYLHTIYSEMAIIYSNQNNQKKVKEYVKKLNQITEESNKHQLNDKSSLVSGVVKVHSLESEKAKLNELNRQQEIRIHQRNMMMLFVSVFIIVLGGLIISIYKSNQKLKKAYNTLAEQSQIIENQKTHLEELNNTKNKFFSIIAHDLKSPIIALKSYSDLILDHLNNIDPEVLIDINKKLSDLLDNTLKMTDNLLAWARMQMNDYESKPETFSVKEIAGEICSVYKDMAERKEITLECNIKDQTFVFGDKYQITFAIRNLINNAIKFTDKGGRIVLNAIDLQNNMVQITISDNGVGFSEDLKEKVFSIGNRLIQTGTAGEKGTGLGLILTNEFIKLNQGTIKLESEQGKGSTFIIALRKDKY